MKTNLVYDIKTVFSFFFLLLLCFLVFLRVMLLLFKESIAQREHMRSYALHIYIYTIFVYSYDVFKSRLLHLPINVRPGKNIYVYVCVIVVLASKKLHVYFIVCMYV